MVDADETTVRRALKSHQAADRIKIYKCRIGAGRYELYYEIVLPDMMPKATGHSAQTVDEPPGIVHEPPGIVPGHIVVEPEENQKREHAVRKEPASKEAKRCALSLPKDWNASKELIQDCKRHRPRLDYKLLEEKFKTYYAATGQARANWDAAFKSFVLKEYKSDDENREQNIWAGAK
jgi:hypothetical protein